MEDIFQKIIDRELPADIVYEDEDVVAFLDIKPVNHGHTLIVPKRKFVNIFDGDPRVLGHMMVTAHLVSKALREVLKCDGMNIAMNNEPCAGQVVFHAHVHVIPRFKNDKAYRPSRHVQYDANESRKIAKNLREALNHETSKTLE